MFKNFDFLDWKIEMFCHYKEQIDEIILSKIKNNIFQINKITQLNYGIFSQKNQDQIISNSGLLFVYNQNNEIIGLFIIPIFFIENKFVCNLGFVFLKENKNKIDFLNIIGTRLNEFIYKKIGSFYIVSITKNPLVYEAIRDNYSKIWPNPNEMRAPSNKEYISILENFEKVYTSLFSAENEKLFFDKKKFILKYENSDATLDKKISDLSPANLLENNLFLNFWLSSQNEMIIIVGEYNKKNIIKNNNRINKKIKNFTIKK